MPAFLTLAELRAMPDDELVRRYDSMPGRSAFGTNFYLAEIRSREMARETAAMLGLSRSTERHTTTMLRLTWWIAGLTAVVTLATIVNVVIAA